MPHKPLKPSTPNPAVRCDLNGEFYIPASRVDQIVQDSINYPPVVSPHHVEVELVKEMEVRWETLEFESEFREHRGRDPQQSLVQEGWDEGQIVRIHAHFQPG